MMKVDKFRKSFFLQRNRNGQVTAEKSRSRVILPCFYLAFLYNQFRIHGHSPPPLSSPSYLYALVIIPWCNTKAYVHYVT